MHHRPCPVPIVGSGKSGKVGRAFRGPCLRQFNSYVGVNGIISGQRCRTLETMDFAKANYAPGNQVGSNRIPKSRRSAFVASNASPWICIFCNDTGHSISYFQNFKILSSANRLQESKRLGLCINCLNVGHQVRQCNSINCRACGSKHHTLLHLGNSPSFPSQEGAQLQEAPPSALSST